MIGSWLALVLTVSPTQVVLTHESPAERSCPNEGWLRDAVTARLGTSPFVEQAPLAARTRVACTATLCTATLEVSRPGEAPRVRELTAAAGQCQELMEQLALALALVLDPLLLMRGRPAEPERAPPPAPTPPPAAQPPEPAEASPLDLQVSAGGFAGLGPTPFVGGGAQVAAGLGVGRIQVWLEGRFEAPHSVSVEGGTVSSQVLLGQVLPCLRLSGLALCAALAAGALSVDGSLPEGKRSSGPLVLAGARVSYTWFFIPWLGVRLHLHALGVLTHASVVANGEPLWGTLPYCADVGAWLVARF